MGKYVQVATVTALFFSAMPCRSGEPAGGHRLWYRRPASKWVEALPVGNGRFGGMIFGGTDRERIQFNDDTVWAGEPRDYAHPGAARHLPTLRRLLSEGKQREAERLAMEEFMSVPLRQMPYLPFGDLIIETSGHSPVKDYSRALDLDSAIATVQYRVGDTTFTREVFASYPDQVIVTRLTADQDRALSFRASLTSPHPGAQTRAAGDDLLILRGRVRDHPRGGAGEASRSAIQFEARLRLIAEGGDAGADGSDLVLRGGRAATLILAGATNFRNYRDVSADPAKRCEGILGAASSKGYQDLRNAHVADHGHLYRRVSLHLGSSPLSGRPTDERIASFGEDNDPDLAALYFQFGRYLLIASSRPGGQPANLQGIWNESMNPPWDSKWTTNINCEMNYWPAEVTNLPECHGPLFDALTDLAESGAKVAGAHYNARGWVLHHNFDLWRGAAPINHSNHGIWPTGGAWLCQHLWWHYQFCGDREFLARIAYPVMRGAAVFLADYLTEDPRSKEKWLISGPSNSPEQGGLVLGPTMDHQIIRDLFANTIEASAILRVDEALRKQLAGMRPRIAPNRIGRYGQLQEWLEDRDDPKNQHRHLSHLWGLHPGSEIHPGREPELADACRVALEHRGMGNVGWSLAWQVNLWARLYDGDRAYRALGNLIAENTNPNIFDQCFSRRPLPFQIDANFGGCAGVAEMLLQSHAGELHLLPALPALWPAGRVTGLRARGGFAVDIAWAKGALTTATIHSILGRPCTVRYGERVIEMNTEKGRSYEVASRLKPP